MKMHTYGLFVFLCGLSAVQASENFQLALIFKFDRVNDVNDICKTDSIWYNKSTAESNVKSFLQAILSNSKANVSVEHVAYQTEPGSWDITCANTSFTNVTNVAVLKVNLTTSAGKDDVKTTLNNFWHGSWDFSVLASIIGNKSHWIACVKVNDVESATKQHGSLHPLDCENTARDTTTSTYNPSRNTNPVSTQNNLSTDTRGGSSTQHFPSTTGSTLLNKITTTTISYGFPSSDSQTTTIYTLSNPGSSGIVDTSSQGQSGLTRTGYTPWKQISSSTDQISTVYESTRAILYSPQSQDSSGGTGNNSSSTVHYSSPSQERLGEIGYSSLKSEQQKKDDPSNALAVGLGIGLGILALLGTLVTLLYRYFSEKNKVSDFTGIYGFPPETPRQSDRSGKSTFRQNMA